MRTQFGLLGEDEPVVVFRARDVLLPDVLSAYVDRIECLRLDQEQADQMRDRQGEVEAWQVANPDLLKTPTARKEPGLWQLTVSTAG